MSLRSTLRKAAGLLVELPPDENEADAGDERRDTSGIAGGMAGGTGGASSTDAMWAELEKAAKTAPSASSPAPTKTIEQIVRDGQGPNLDQISVTPEKLPADVSVDGTMDYSTIYAAAHLPAVPYTAEQVLELLASLPPGLPLDARRMMVKAAVNSMGKAIGATPENIVSDASRKLAALAAYTEHQSALVSEYTAAAEAKIASLQAQIETTRQGISSAQQKQFHEMQQCQAESQRLDDVLEFFSLDVPPSKYAAGEAGASPSGSQG